MPTKVLTDHDMIDISSREIEEVFLTRFISVGVSLYFYGKMGVHVVIYMRYMISFRKITIGYDFIRLEHKTVRWEQREEEKQQKRKK